MLPSTMPRFGWGTWRMGERSRARAQEIAAVRAGLELGVALIDTAEMYGDGSAEEIVGEAIAGRRDDVYIVSKCYPHHAGARSMPAACEGSLKRLRIERIDCYLLHWRGRTPLAETVDTFERLVREGKIARWGVSNFDVDDMQELFALSAGKRCLTNQVLYHLKDRAAEGRLLDLCRANGVTLMAYSPLGQGSLLRDRALQSIASSIGATPAQLALAFVLLHENVIAIPKASNIDHLRENVAALDLTLDEATRAKLDASFPRPSGTTPLSFA
ncbi:MAG TPA: aldo/keto reductase [Casimicrobiaceae bacterium]|nr:aldo/keto reductase [Casimicrobiaceae bacterium]